MRARACRALAAFFFSGGSPERLGATRLLLGLGLVPFFALQYQQLVRIDWGGPHFHYFHPVWYFAALGIEFHHPALIGVAAIALSLALLGFALGVHARGCAWVALALILLLKGARDSMSGDVHHRELIPFHVLLFFALSRCGDVLARGGGRAPLAAWEASWPIRAGQLYTAAFYLWSGLAKLRASGLDWFFGGDALRGVLLARAVRFGFSPTGEPSGSALGFWLAHQPELMPVLGLGVLLMELGFPLLLFVRSLRLRLVCFAGIAFFHVANYVLIKVKFLFMPVVFVLFFDLSGFVRRWLARPLGLR